MSYDTQTCLLRGEIESKLVELLPMLKRFAMFLTNNEQYADDLVQDVALKVLSNTETYVCDINFSGWVSMIMHNAHVNTKRRRSRCVYVADESFFDIPICDTSVDVREVLLFIESSPKCLREPLELYIKGYKYEEIAAELSIPVGTVKSRINKLRTFMRLRFML